MLDILCDENADTLKIRPDTLTACSLVFSRNGFTICDTTALELVPTSVFSVSTEKALNLMKLSAPMQKFVVHWGEMGARWGVNRSIAQIHALLYLADEPLHAEEITDILQIARSNVSNSLKELQAFGLVSLEHKLGDRRDHFVATHEPWDMLMAIADARNKREIDPTIAILKECAAYAEADPETPKVAAERLKRMEEFVGNVTDWYGQMRDIPQGTLIKLMKLGTRIAKFVGG